jgi:DNA-binding beta-propeller fold protein YncE
MRRVPPAALVALALLAPTVTWAQAPAFITSWPVTGPEDVAVDASGNVFVTTDAQQVLKFTSGGALVGQWGSSGSGNGQFLSVQGITVDAAGNVYVADTGNHRIQKFDNNGNFLLQWGIAGSGVGQLIGPTGLEVDNASHVLVLDETFSVPFISRIERFADTGDFLEQWGSHGSAPGQFDGPFTLASAPDGRIYIGDTGNHRVDVFSADGAFLFQWGSQGQFGIPSGIAVDGAGRVYVADNGYFRIEVFDSEGQYLMQIGAAGHGVGQFFGILGIAVDAAGNLFVCDGNNRIQVFGPIPTAARSTSWGALKARYRP